MKWNECEKKNVYDYAEKPNREYPYAITGQLFMYIKLEIWMAISECIHTKQRKIKWKNSDAQKIGQVQRYE